MKRYLTFLMLIFSFAASMAAEHKWIGAYEDDEVTVYFYSKIKKNASGYGVWLLWELNKPEPISGKYAYSYKEYVEFSQSFESYKSFEAVWYDKSGKAVHSSNDSYPSMKRIIPDSRMEGVAEEVEEWLKAHPITR